MEINLQVCKERNIIDGTAAECPPNPNTAWA